MKHEKLGNQRVSSGLSSMDRLGKKNRPEWMVDRGLCEL